MYIMTNNFEVQSTIILVMAIRCESLRIRGMSEKQYLISVEDSKEFKEVGNERDSVPSFMIV